MTFYSKIELEVMTVDQLRSLSEVVKQDLSESYKGFETAFNDFSEKFSALVLEKTKDTSFAFFTGLRLSTDSVTFVRRLESGYEVDFSVGFRQRYNENNEKSTNAFELISFSWYSTIYSGRDDNESCYKHLGYLSAVGWLADKVKAKDDFITTLYEGTNAAYEIHKKFDTNRKEWYLSDINSLIEKKIKDAKSYGMYSKLKPFQIFTVNQRDVFKGDYDIRMAQEIIIAKLTDNSVFFAAAGNTDKTYRLPKVEFGNKIMSGIIVLKE